MKLESIIKSATRLIFKLKKYDITSITNEYSIHITNGYMDSNTMTEYNAYDS